MNAENKPQLKILHAIQLFKCFKLFFFYHISQPIMQLWVLTTVFPVNLDSTWLSYILIELATYIWIDKTKAIVIVKTFI